MFEENDIRARHIKTTYGRHGYSVYHVCATAFQTFQLGTMFNENWSETWRKCDLHMNGNLSRVKLLCQLATAGSVSLEVGRYLARKQVINICSI